MSNSSLRALHDELRACQRRLGTPAELSGDFESAMALAHEINNHMTVEYFHAATRAPAEALPSMSSVWRTVTATRGQA